MCYITCSQKGCLFLAFSLLFIVKKVVLEEKASFGANLKNMFLQNFAANFLLFFQLFAIKNVKIAYFNQRLDCAAPKRWSKYTAIR